MSIPGSLTPLFSTGSSAAAAYQIERSLRFNSADSAYLSRTPAVAGNRKTWTWAGWVKRSGLSSGYPTLFSSGSGTGRLLLQFGPGDTFLLDVEGSGSRATPAVFRDPSAWYHVIVAFDTTQATAADRTKVWINNNLQTLSGITFSQNTDYAINNNAEHRIGCQTSSLSDFFNGYLADIHFIDGQALTPSSFTEVSATTGQLISIAYTGTYGLVSVAAATGALPVFNTTDTYGAVKGTGTRTDTNSAYIALALPMDGTNGGTSFGDQSAVIRGSGSAKTVTVNGNTNTSTTQSKFYGSSGYFDGTGDYLQTPYSTDFNFGSGDFTIETFVNISALGTSKTIANYIAPTAVTGNDLGWIFGINGSNQIEGVLYNGSSAVGLIQSGSLVTGKWYHAAYVRSGTNFYMFLDGVLIGTATGSAAHNVNTGWNISIGYGHSSGTQFMNGYLQDLRIYKGAAKYTSNFSPVVSLVNSFQLKFSDNSAATAATLGKDYSGNSNNWTPNNLSTSTGEPTSVAAATGALPVFNTTDTYGVVKGTGTRTDTNSASIVLALPMDGTNGGTSFGDQSAVIRGSGSAKTVTVTGNTSTRTAISKFYGSSGYFDGSGDYLTFASSADLTVGTGAFTAEIWVYPLSQSAAILFQNYDNNNGGWGLRIQDLGGSVNGVSYAGPIIGFTSGTLPTSSWSHVAAVWSATGSNCSVYINGVLKRIISNIPSTAQNTFWIGAQGDSGPGVFFNGYIQDLRIYKGVAKYTGSFNPPTATIIGSVAAANDSLVDSPTSFGTDTSVGGEVRGNYATLNPLDNGGLTLANGNLDFSRATASWVSSRSTFGVSSGKWYWEVTLSTGNDCMAGISKNDAALSSYFASVANGWAYNAQNGQKYNNGSSSAYGNSWVGGNDTVGVAFDADAGSIYFYKNGAVQNSGNAAFTGLTSGPYFPSVALYGTGTAFINFGQRPFAYQTPGTNRPAATFLALCDTNLGAPLIAKPNQHFDAITYTGNGSTLTIPNVNSTPTSIAFDPGFIWFKQRASPKRDHNVYDVIRGTTKLLSTNGTSGDASTYDVYPGNGAEQTVSGLTAFNTGSKTVDVGSSNVANGSSSSYVAWAWYAGATTDPSNQAGSITSQVRANVSAGFSVVTFTGNATAGATVGHGLGVAPEFLISKSRSDTGGWLVYHKSIGNTKYLALNSTIAEQTSSDAWNNTTPSSTVFTLGGSGAQPSGITRVAYCFAPVIGYSSFGSYTGNGSTDGPFIFTSFRPRWLLIKRYDSAGNWVLIDTSRSKYNPATTEQLFPHLSDAEYSNSAESLDILSNGFKPRSATSGHHNYSGYQYLYIAFAENPFQYARAR